MSDDGKCIRCGKQEKSGTVYGVLIGSKQAPPLNYCRDCWPYSAGSWKRRAAAAAFIADLPDTGD